LASTRAACYAPGRRHAWRRKIAPRTVLSDSIQTDLAGIAFDTEDTPAGRILRTARALLLTRRYSGLTMDALAHELGMSKKTLYTHYASKDALAGAIIDTAGATIRRHAALVLDDPRLRFTQKLHGVLTLIGAQFSVLTPAFVHDVQRFAPALFRQLGEMRERNIPLVFGRLLELGVAEGLVRPDMDVGFLVEFWLQAMHGLQQPVALARTGLTPRETFERGLDLFCRGLLTERGRAEYGTQTASDG
jgi:AcrR family transcriptional regulator